jgi:hypothetical protein
MAMNDNPVKTAVVTGGHSFDVISFQKLFRLLEGVDAFVQHMDDFASSPESVRDSYGAVVFYIMLTEGPCDEGQPGYAGKPRKALEHLGDTEQGILLLHHAILAYPRWQAWREISGIESDLSGFDHAQTIHFNVPAAEHPITRGLTDWEMVDETYTMAEPQADNRILITATHPKSMRSIGWTRQHKKARVFCYQSGHDDEAWRNSTFREILRRGIQWVARRP